MAKNICLKFEDLDVFRVSLTKKFENTIQWTYRNLQKP